MRRRRWIEVTLRIPSSHHDLITGQLASFGFTGFLQSDNLLAAYFPMRSWTARIDHKLRNFLQRFKKEFPRVDAAYSTSTVREENWNARWERSAGIIEATPRIIIKPAWKNLRVRDRGKIILHIDPKMSFGTGHHETTRLCLVLLEQFTRKGLRVFDVGCGTGVLSIAAAKLGARRVIAVDNDPWACANARENLKRNRVKGIHVMEGNPGDVKLQSFDLVLSNIDLPTNIRFLPRLVRMLGAGGVLIVSGMLAGDLPGFLDAIKGRKIVPVEILEENEWVAVALARI